MATACKTIAILRAKNADLRQAIEDVRDLIDDYVDVKDGDHGPVPNSAMRAVSVIDAAPPGFYQEKSSHAPCTF